MIGFTRDSYGKKVRALIPVYAIGQNGDGEHCIVKTCDLIWSRVRDGPSGFMLIPNDCIRKIFGYLPNDAKRSFVYASKKLRQIVFDLRYITTYDYKRRDCYERRGKRSDPFSPHFCKKTVATINTDFVNELFKNNTPIIELILDYKCRRPSIHVPPSAPVNFHYLYYLGHIKFMLIMIKGQIYYIANIFSLRWDDSTNARKKLTRELYVLCRLMESMKLRGYEPDELFDNALYNLIDIVENGHTTNFEREYPKKFDVGIPDDIPREISTVYDSYEDPKPPVVVPRVPTFAPRFRRGGGK